MKPAVAAAEETTLSANVYHRIRADIISGRLEPGSHLRLEAMRRRYGVSLSPVREALLRLAADTFVDAVENRGYRVAAMSRADLEDITASRVLLERDLLAQAIAAGDDAWETAIVAAHYRLAKADARIGELVGPDAPDDAFDHWEQANRAFHDALVAASRPGWLWRFRALLQDQAKRYVLFSLRESAAVRRVDDEHDGLMRAALDRDAPLALELIENHIRSTADIVLNKLPVGAEEAAAG